MKIKTKISLGLLFLFALFLLIGGLGTYNLYRISQSMKGILKANFETIEYTKNMLKSLDDMRDLIDENPILPLKINPLFVDFERNLSNQEHNVTEIGEKELTQNLRNSFESLKKEAQNPDVKILNYTISRLNKHLYDINEINSRPIIRKNKEAEKTAQDAIFLMAVVATFCFLISFSFIFNFPSYIANPIRELTGGIKEIANRNYRKRLNFTSKDEFGELAEAFNTMAQRLDEYEHSNLAKIISEKQRTETIIDTLHDPLIGFDEKNRILFVNTEGVAVLGLKKEDLIGQYAPDVALKNDLLRTLLTETPPKTLKIFANGKESYFEKEVLNMTTTEKPIGKVILLRNITVFQERDLANTHFVAKVSHALKVPILSMSKKLTLLENGDFESLTTEQKKCIHEMKEDSKHLTEIIGELLNLSKNGN